MRRLTSSLSLLVLMLVGGCSNPFTTTLSTEGVVTSGGVKNDASLTSTPEGSIELRGSNPSIPHIPILVDDGNGRGVWAGLAGLGGGLQLGDGSAAVAGTGDVDADSIELRADGTFIVTGFRFAPSRSTAAFDVQVTSTIDAIRLMNADEARRYVDSLVATGQIAASVGELIIQAHTGGILP